MSFLVVPSQGGHSLCVFKAESLYRSIYAVSFGKGLEHSQRYKTSTVLLAWTNYNGMSKTPARFTEADISRIFKAAAKAHIDVRVKIALDGSILIATCQADKWTGQAEGSIILLG